MKMLSVLQLSAYFSPSGIFLPPFISMKICSGKQKKKRMERTYPKFKLGEEVVRVLCMCEVCMVK